MRRLLPALRRRLLACDCPLALARYAGSSFQPGFPLAQVRFSGFIERCEYWLIAPQGRRFAMI
jgi:hypothetical protein